MQRVLVTDKIEAEGLAALNEGRIYALHVKEMYDPRASAQLARLLVARHDSIPYTHDTLGPDGEIISNDYGVDSGLGIVPFNACMIDPRKRAAYFNQTVQDREHDNTVMNSFRRDVYELHHDCIWGRDNVIWRQGDPPEKMIDAGAIAYLNQGFPDERLFRALHKAGVTYEIPKIYPERPDVDPVMHNRIAPAEERFESEPLRMRAGLYRITRPNATILETNLHMDTVGVYFNTKAMIGANIYLQQPAQGGELIFAGVDAPFSAEEVKALEADPERFKEILARAPVHELRPEAGDAVFINTRVPHGVRAYTSTAPSDLRVSFNMFLCQRELVCDYAGDDMVLAGHRDPDYFAYS